MGTIALTGAGGYIGQRLIEHLDRWEGCTAILGTDVREPLVRSRKLTFLKKDIRDMDLDDFWKGRDVEALVHLAFVVDPIRDEKRMYDINVNGTLNVLRICRVLEIPHVIVASSGTAYGAWPDNPPRLLEDDPIRVFPPTMSYAHHKGVNEQHFADFREKNPGVRFNAVRPSIVYGPNVDNYLSRFLKRLPFLPLPDGCDPEFQLVHEEDVARLFTLLLEKKVDGPFNVAGSGVLRFSQVGAMVGKRAVRIPRRVLVPILGLLWRAHLLVEAPPGMVDFMAYPWVLDIGRARDLLGFEPEYSTEQTARIMFQTHGYHVLKPA